MIVFALLGSADAAIVQQTVCFELNSNYDELIPNATWWTTNGQRKMFGVRVEIYGDTWPYLEVEYADETGSNAGCATFDLDTNRKYDIRIEQRAKIYGRDIYVVDDIADPISAVGGQMVYPDFVPDGVTRTYSIAHTREWGSLNVATWMFRRNSFGLSASGHPLRIAVPHDNSGTAAAVDYIRINTDRKRTISHEIGHWIGNRRDEETIIVHDGSAPLDGCDGGGNDDLTKEYDSRAASEGWADYIAAWAWNTQNVNACSLQKLGTDWDFDLDGDGDSPADIPNGIETGQWSCETTLADMDSDGSLDDKGEPLWTGWSSSSNYDPPSPSGTTSDWLENMVLSDDDDQDGIQCQGTLAGVSSKADWVRFFWDFCRDYSITATQCAAVFDAANPRNWDGDPDGTGYLANDPIRRMRSAADSAGFLTEFDLEAHNGLDHY